jgi:hypothetical protein
MIHHLQCVSLQIREWWIMIHPTNPPNLVRYQRETGTDETPPAEPSRGNGDFFAGAASVW